MDILKRLDIKKHGRLAARTLVGIAIGLGILLLAKTTTVIVQGATARTKVSSAFDASKKAGNAIELYKKHSQEEMKTVTEKKPFGAEAQKPQTPQCAGIMGDEVLFNGQWYKAGADVGGAKILKIDPTFVMVQFEGKEVVVTPQSRVDPNARMQGPGVARGGPGEDNNMRRGGDFGGPGGGRGGRGGFGGFGNMSPEQMGQMRDRFMNMSPEERRNAMRQMRENMGNQDH
jgi:hypothetical protein